MTKNRIDVRLTIAMLAERFPAAFSVWERRRRPLKIGVHLDILARLDGEIEPDVLSIAMRVYTANEGYLKSCTAGAARIDLDGNPAGEVTPEQAAGCLSRLEARRAKRKPPAPVAEVKAEPAPEKPKRLSLGDLKAAALARRKANA